MVVQAGRKVDDKFRFDVVKNSITKIKHWKTHIWQF